MHFIIIIGYPNWNLFFQKKLLPEFSDTRKSSKMRKDVAHGPPKLGVAITSTLKKLRKMSICVSICGETVGFQLAVWSSATLLCFPTFCAHKNNFLKSRFVTFCSNMFDICDIFIFCPRFGQLPGFWEFCELFFLKV